jgi:3-methyladenine DNA glycosylase/8-oxoguanine DNA glycosylase
MQTVNPFEDLVIAVLAVNNFSLERAYSLREALDREGLFSVKTIRELPVQEVAAALERAKYQRGSFMTPLLARRLKTLADVAGRDNFTESISSKDPDRITKALTGIPGIGPTVMKNYLLLHCS